MSNIPAIVPLANIPVVDADLKAKKGDIVIAKYGFDDQADFSEIITSVKQELHNKIQTANGYDDDTMALVKDTQLETMKRKIVYQSISEVYRSNNRWDAADSYQAKADRTPIEFVVDSNEDDTQDTGELDRVPSYVFGR